MGEPTVTTASKRFRFVQLVSRTLLRSQYRRIEVVGAEKVPAEGAVMILANHFRSLLDPMALLDASPRPASFLAKAPLWQIRVLAYFLDAVGALPVFRPQDVPEIKGRTTRANLKTFEICRERLAEGGSIALFPEGVSQPRPRLMPVRTGASRIALDAGVPVTICPTALVYEPPLGGRRGSLLVLFGEPFVVNGLEGYASRRAAITDTTRKIETELRGLLAETDSVHDMEALRTLRMVWDQERDVPQAATLAERHRRNQEFARQLVQLDEVAPGEIRELRAETDSYVRSLDQVGIPPEHLQGSYTKTRVARFLLVKVPLLLLTLPLALAAGVLTWPSRHIGDVVALRTFGGMEDVRSLCRALGGSLMLVVAMVLGGILAGILWGWWVGLATFVGIPVLLAFYVWWRDRTVATRASLRSFILLAGANLRRSLQTQRRALYDRLVAVGDLLRPADRGE